MPTFIHKNLVGADAIHPAAFVQATDPGSVGANLLWIDTSTSPPGLKVRNVGNTAWTVFGSTGPAGATGATGAAGTNGTNGTNGAAGPAGPVGSNIVSGAAPYVNIQDQKPLGTQGGGFTSGAFQTRTLNTVVANDQFMAALNNNQITLPSGTYRCAISCPADINQGHQARLQNITDSATVLWGTTAFGGGTDFAVTLSLIVGRFSIRTSTTFEIQHRCNNTRATNGFGVAASIGTEIYTVAEFWLEGPPPPFMGTTYLTAGQQQQINRSRPDFQQHSLNTPPQ